MSLRSCVASKPPLVVFVLGIFAFALTTFVLAVTIEGRDKVRDPDAFDWDTFFLKITQLDYCVSDRLEEEEGDRDRRAVGPGEKAEAGEGSETAAVSLLVPMTADFIRSFRSSVHRGGTGGNILTRGTVLMDHLDRGRLAKYRGMTVEVTLALPASPAAAAAASGDEDVCLGVRAPAELLSDLNAGSAPDNCTLPSPSGAAFPFVSHTKDHLPPSWCANGTAMQLTYEEQPDWVVYLSQADKDLVNLHLLCTSAFLFALGATAIALAAFRGCGKPAGPAWSATKTSGDGRGDLELLPQHG